MRTEPAPSQAGAPTPAQKRARMGAARDLLEFLVGDRQHRSEQAMRRRGGLAGVTASPTMVGALTVMVVILAVFLAYNANTGLPFVPTYRVSASLPDAAQLVPGNEVRIGGVRVGQIEDDRAGADERRQRTAPAST